MSATRRRGPIRPSSPKILLILGLCLPNVAFAQRLRMTPPNSPATATAVAAPATAPNNGGLSIDLNGSGLLDPRQARRILFHIGRSRGRPIRNRIDRLSRLFDRLRFHWPAPRARERTTMCVH